MKRGLAVALLLLTVVGHAELRAAGLPFIPDDYAKALSEAQQRKLPIFVECWAPW